MHVGADTKQFDAALRSSVSDAPDDVAAAAAVLTSVQAELQVDHLHTCININVHIHWNLRALTHLLESLSQHL